MNGKIKKIILCLIPATLLLFGCANIGASASDKLKPLQGAWKCKEHLNYRIEINNDNLIILFLNNPFFETKIIDVKINGQRNDMILEKTTIANADSSGSYKEITSFFYENGILHYRAEGIASYNKGKIDDYTFTPTTESRYGDVTIKDDILRKLQGTWKDEKGITSFTIKENKIKINDDEEIPIVAIEDNSNYKTVIIRPADAGRRDFKWLTTLYYKDGVITGSIMIMDARRPELIFRKID